MRVHDVAGNISEAIPPLSAPRAPVTSKVGPGPAEPAAYTLAAAFAKSAVAASELVIPLAGAYARPLSGSTSALFAGYLK